MPTYPNHHHDLPDRRELDCVTAMRLQRSHLGELLDREADPNDAEVIAVRRAMQILERERNY